MLFKDIVGQEELKKQLTETARKGTVAHAQLFCGQPGAGAFPLALAYARYLNCTDRSETDACGKCKSCLQYNELAHPDLHFVFPIVANKEGKKTVCDDYLAEWCDFLKTYAYFDLNRWLDRIEAGNKQALIYAEESDRILRKVSLKIYEAEYRILLIWMPERMNIACANKLLKIIEEPPKNTVILMVSDTPEQILGTILSRTQRLNVRPITAKALTEATIQQYHIEPDAARQIAHLAHGNMLEAEKTLSTEQESDVFLEFFIRMMRNSWARNVKEMKNMAEELSTMTREKQKSFLNYCQHLIRENFVYRFRSDDLNYMKPNEAAFSARFSPFVNERNVFDLIRELADAERHISQNGNAKMIFFDLSLQITVLLKK